MVTIVDFGNLFPVVNNSDEHSFRRWLFQSGMGYGDLEFWWSGLPKKRPRAHEGIDFFCYEDSRGRIHSLAQILVPAPCAGEVVAVCPDFLGQSLFLRVDHPKSHRCIVVLAHIASHLHVGQRVEQGDVAGRVVGTPGEVPPHLHVSLLLGDERDLPAKLSWPALLDQQRLRFVRPFSI